LSRASGADHATGRPCRTRNLDLEWPDNVPLSQACPGPHKHASFVDTGEEARLALRVLLMSVAAECGFSSPAVEYLDGPLGSMRLKAAGVSIGQE